MFKQIFTIILCLALLTSLSIGDVGVYRKKNILNSNWARCIGNESDGLLTANADITVDIDYRNEDWKTDAAAILFGYGIRMNASASVNASKGDHEGRYALYAYVPNDENEQPEREWVGKASDNVSASDTDDRYGEISNFFEAAGFLSSLTAWSDISSASDSAYGNAYNFSYDPSIEWNCYVSGDTSCSICN